MANDVGYGKPPKHTRWKKGQSGNPRGRPKGSGDFAQDLLAELGQLVQITEGGKVKRITKQRALLKALTVGAMKGDARASALLIRLCATVLQANANPAGLAAPSAAETKIVEDYIERQVQLRLAQRQGGQP